MDGLDLPYVPLTNTQRQFLSTVDNNIYWATGNVIIMFQGKCANTAIKAAILESEGGVDTSINIHADPRLVYVNNDWVIKNCNKVPVIATVRRPWDRITSFWRDKVSGRTERTYTNRYIPDVYPDMPFPEFVQAVLKCKPIVGDLRPAADYLYAYGMPIPRKIFKFEYLTTELGWKEFRHWTAKAWDLPTVLPHLNRPKRPEPAMDRDTENKLRLSVFGKYYIDYKTHGWKA